MRLKGKVAIVIGAGQSPGEGMGNGRATVIRFAPPFTPDNRIIRASTRRSQST